MPLTKEDIVRGGKQAISKIPTYIAYSWYNDTTCEVIRDNFPPGIINEMVTAFADAEFVCNNVDVVIARAQRERNGFAPEFRTHFDVIKHQKDLDRLVLALQDYKHRAEEIKTQRELIIREEKLSGLKTVSELRNDTLPRPYVLGGSGNLNSDGNYPLYSSYPHIDLASNNYQPAVNSMPQTNPEIDKVVREEFHIMKVESGIEFCTVTFKWSEGSNDIVKSILFVRQGAFINPIKRGEDDEVKAKFNCEANFTLFAVSSASKIELIRVMCNDILIALSPKSGRDDLRKQIAKRKERYIAVWNADKSYPKKASKICSRLCCLFEGFVSAGVNINLLNNLEKAKIFYVYSQNFKPKKLKEGVQQILEAFTPPVKEGDGTVLETRKSPILSRVALHKYCSEGVTDTKNIYSKYNNLLD